MDLKEIFKTSFSRIIKNSFAYNAIKKRPSEWASENIYMTSAQSSFEGYLNYDISPYTRFIIDYLGPEDPCSIVAVMKGSQSGLTSTVIVPIITYYMSENPCNIIFISGKELTLKGTVVDRLDPVIHNNSKLKNLIGPSVKKKANQKSGDTDSKKEFPGGSLTSITYSPSNLRQFSAKVMLCDEFDDAPRNDKKEGSIRSLIEGRTKSFGSSKKILYNSTPTISGQSNIEEIYNLGDKRHVHWECPHCKEYILIDWSIERPDGTFGGIKWELDDNNKLIKDSIHYECQNCRGKILERQKYDLNLKLKLIPTCEPIDPEVKSIRLTSIVIPVGFDGWYSLVKQWLLACPTGGVVDQGKLKVFINQHLGQVWEDRGTVLKVNELMENCRSYHIGVVPDNTIKNDGNGSVALISMSCDLGGIMNKDIEDVRLDYEIIAHTTKGRTYSITHGSIGTFKRSREMSRKERDNDSNRELWTYTQGANNCVWDKLIEIIKAPLLSESGIPYDINITLVDTGEFTKLAYNFIESVDDCLVLGIKGVGQDEYRKLSRDTPIISRSREMLGKLYLLQVNQLKDILSQNIQLKRGIDGFQPIGFMNFPQPENGKYKMSTYFSHFEAEKRVPEIKDGVEVGYVWKKKHSHVRNHFFDCAVYNLAAKDIYMDYLRKNFKQYREWTWDDYCEYMSD